MSDSHSKTVNAEPSKEQSETYLTAPLDEKSTAGNPSEWLCKEKPSNSSDNTAHKDITVHTMTPSEEQPPTSPKRKRVSEDDDDKQEGSSTTPTPGSPPKRARSLSPSPSHTLPSRPRAKVTFHPDTLDNWRWADRSIAERTARPPTPFVTEPGRRLFEDDCDLDDFDEEPVVDGEMSRRATGGAGGRGGSPPPRLDDVEVPRSSPPPELRREAESRDVPDKVNEPSSIKQEQARERGREQGEEGKRSVPSIFFNPPPPSFFVRRPAPLLNASDSPILTMEEIAKLREIIVHQLDHDGRRALDRLLRYVRAQHWATGYRTAMLRRLHPEDNHESSVGLHSRDAQEAA